MEQVTSKFDTVKVDTYYDVADYSLLSKLFEYPHTESDCKTWLDACAYLVDRTSETQAVLQHFIEFIQNSTLTQIQELFLRSFDVQAITTLDIGYILFGEDYKRGELLVNLNREHREAGNICETELSDHLPNVLRLLPLMKDVELREELVQVLLIPAMDKMIAEFETKKIEKKDEVYKKHLKTVIEYSREYRVAYQCALLAVRMTLQADFLPDHECECCMTMEQSESNAEPTPILMGTSCDSHSEVCSHKNVPNDFGGTIENEFDVENQ